MSGARETRCLVSEVVLRHITTESAPTASHGPDYVITKSIATKLMSPQPWLLVRAWYAIGCACFSSTQIIFAIKFDQYTRIFQCLLRYDSLFRGCVSGETTIAARDRSGASQQTPLPLPAHNRNAPAPFPRQNHIGITSEALPHMCRCLWVADYRYS